MTGEKKVTAASSERVSEHAVKASVVCDANATTTRTLTPLIFAVELLGLTVLFLLTT